MNQVATPEVTVQPETAEQESQPDTPDVSAQPETAEQESQPDVASTQVSTHDGIQELLGTEC